MQKQYSQAPLPFMGQKRMFAKEFRQILKQFSEATVFVDLFGGSGLLSHITKCEKPNATVVYNDYDNYRKRLENIPKTNALLTDLRAITVMCPHGKIIPEDVKETLLNRIAREEQTGFVDYITLSTSLLFSMKYVLTFESLCKETFYSHVKMTDYNADGYLAGLVIESSDYKDIFQKYKDIPDVVFLIDPPYLYTEAKMYNMSWNLADYLDVLTILHGISYVYFTSNKSSILELCEWIERNNRTGNPFVGANKRVFNAHMNFNSTYLDIMLYKKPNVYKLDA
ncbi:MAG: DNA adenine methylase [Dysgonamonadaceae bacterium]|jgi:16S rRNA G966 N2-methylase RsmD|nr:DNA adenine methylase [Dysgonamonadaceae bacterium]